MIERIREAADDPDVKFRDISLADARARVAAAIELGAITFPPFETETWPASRPLTEWLLRLLAGLILSQARVQGLPGCGVQSSSESAG